MSGRSGLQDKKSRDLLFALACMFGRRKERMSQDLPLFEVMQEPTVFAPALAKVVVDDGSSLAATTLRDVDSLAMGLRERVKAIVYSPCRTRRQGLRRVEVRSGGSSPATRQALCCSREPRSTGACSACS